MTIDIRPARVNEQRPIQVLVRGERLNPNNLAWENFIVAVDDGRLVAAAQVRPHAGGVRELGSLVVDKTWRGKGLAGALVSYLIAREAGPLYMITGNQHAAHYARWGFVPVAVRMAPASIRRNFLLGQSIGGIAALVTGRRINRLVVLKREAQTGEAETRPYERQAMTG